MFDDSLSGRFKFQETKEAELYGRAMQRVSCYRGRINKSISTFALQIICMGNRSAMQGSKMELSGSIVASEKSRIRKFPASLANAKSDFLLRLQFLKSNIKSLLLLLVDHLQPQNLKALEDKVLAELAYIEFCIPVICKIDKVAGLNFYIEEVEWFKHLHEPIYNLEKWIRLGETLASVTPHSAMGSKRLISALGIGYNSVFNTEQKEIFNLHKQLKLMKIAKWLVEIDGKSISSNTRLKGIKIKSQITFLEGHKFELSSNGAHGAMFIKWKKRDDSYKNIAVLKVSQIIVQAGRSRSQTPLPKSSLINNIFQAVGFYTKTSQQAVVAGAGSAYKEACAEKAAFMIAEAFQKLLLDYIATNNNQNIQITCPLNSEMFSPMIAGIAALPGENKTQISIGSIAIFEKNCIDTLAANKIAQILEKKLDDSELLIFQLFILFDYILGNTDRHLENWMLQLSYKDSQDTYAFVRDQEHLSKLVNTEHLRKDDFVIRGLLPIDNGNILPTQDLCSTGLVGMVLDSKQYEWKNLKFAAIPFHSAIIDFIKAASITKVWASDVGAAINNDMEIKRYSQDIGGSFISKSSLLQLHHRIHNLNKIANGSITTPKVLAFG